MLSLLFSVAVAATAVVTDPYRLSPVERHLVHSLKFSRSWAMVDLPGANDECHCAEMKNEQY